jgi:hypothetical protein
LASAAGDDVAWIERADHATATRVDMKAGQLISALWWDACVSSQRNACNSEVDTRE